MFVRHRGRDERMSTVSPRPAKPDIRQALVEAAAHLLAHEGPAALTTRRLAAEVGTSTMSVYTYFGSIRDVVREVVREGFDRLAGRLAAVPITDDPVADLANLTRVYRKSALADPSLYAVMFGGSSIAGFQLSEEDRAIGLRTLRTAVDCVRRCVETGRFRPTTDAWLVARQLWCAVHGLVILELGGYFSDEGSAERCLDAQLRDFPVGAGDTFEAANRSVTGQDSGAECLHR